MERIELPMKTIAYWALHYGKEYLAWSIRSVQDAVDEIHVLYTDQPSFGYRGAASCPDSESELKEEAQRFLTKPLHWHKGRWEREGEHRAAIIDIANGIGAERVLVVDADEVWAPGAAASALAASAGHDEKDTLARFIHFWRSLHYVCHDPCMPVRIINPRASGGTWYLDPQDSPVLHFGYAQSEALTRYKIGIHGHKGEWRPEWLGRFLAWRPGSLEKDLHPTNRDFWAPEKTSPQEAAWVSATLWDHPYFGMDFVP
jgi:hypothetical protein